MENKMRDDQSSQKSLSDPQTLQAVKKIISTFVLALRNLSLYPDGHEISVSSVSNLEKLLIAFLEKHQSLRIDVKNDHFLFEEEIVFSGEADETNPAFILFRDGIQRIEFSQGVHREELDKILKLINDYSITKEEPEGDLVTAFWDMNLSHFEYIATDMLWEAEPLYDLFLERQGEMEGFRLEIEGAEEVVDPEDKNNHIKNPLLDVYLNIIDVNDWRLNEDEKNVLQKRVADEIQKEAKEDVFDVLLYILRKQDKENDFLNILEFMKEELRKALVECEFNEALIFLKNLGKIRIIIEESSPWSLPLIEKFYNDISSYKFLYVLDVLWPAISLKDEQLHDALRQILMLLKPDCVLTLLPMLSKISSDLIRIMLIDVITQHAISDISPLQQLLSNPQTAVVRNIVFVLNRLEGNSPVNMLLRVLRHPSEYARKDALKALIRRDFEKIKELFFLMDDTDDEIRQLLLNFLGRQRNRNVEELLLGYLRNLNYKGDDSRHILDCYGALGKCGSDFSILYLEESLFKEKWNVGATRSLHRQGACIALGGLSIEKADDVLKKASKSMIPSVRKAYNSVRVTNNE